MSTSRLLTSSLRTVARRTAAYAPARRQLAPRSAARRAYSSSEHAGSAGAEKSSDMPWLIGSVTVTAIGLAWILSPGPVKKTSSKTHGGAPVPDEEKAPAIESGEDSSSSPPSPPSSESSPESSSPSDSSDSSSSETPAPQDGNPQATFGSGQTGRQVPPPSADSSDMAAGYEEKKDAHERDKAMMERKDTRVAASSSDVPSKKTAAEHPREDPQKGEGEGAKKGDSNSSSPS
ncbi:uncharacterized protein F4812DRAFT_303817 [Daldinia caldariorum]|uniref:uncharacterized protein n=1 Tax=Daldinia caldariorum TaxID=326644 RepID=UPI002007A462|nr:uncharacterized protein F4812DRAFT_303817 [Daldinia caldariorum]KAI1469802.1 hypothetical protein F4812DRAFT_303817 [Daldinia caldariorum]